MTTAILHRFPFVCPKADGGARADLDHRANAIAIAALSRHCPAVRERRIIPRLHLVPNWITLNHRCVALRIMEAVCTECKPWNDSDQRAAIETIVNRWATTGLGPDSAMRMIAATLELGPITEVHDQEPANETR